MIEWVVQQLIALLGPISAMQRERRELADNALRSISHALNETYLYYRAAEGGRRRDIETEAQLSRLWAAAAIPIRHLDVHLAEICERKSEYWVNPESWDMGQIEQLGIGLHTVREQYREKLRLGVAKKAASK